jgi:hypothetical protein
MDTLWGAGAARSIVWLFSPCSPTTYVFLLLLTIVVCVITLPDLNVELCWLLVILFSVIALSQDSEREE